MLQDVKTHISNNLHLFCFLIFGCKMFPATVYLMAMYATSLALYAYSPKLSLRDICYIIL